ncbi:MAG: putative c-type cytochrome biosis protein CcdA [Candidatus Eremiobacteraeota bacterium]|nr:putative c-type cytochrome biosis protein CcdA [Candidatus Eremiobacteraeota bacterium]
MIDVVGEALRAAGTRSLLAYPLAFAAGGVTAVGPCAAPRYVAVAALAHAARRPWVVVAAFAAGLVGAYVMLGFAAGAAGALWSASAYVYAGLALLLAGGGVATLLRAGHGDAAGPCAHDQPGPRASLGGSFLLGASSAFVVSPCCTPVVAAIAGLTLTGGRTGEGTALLAAFACGHALPVLVAGSLGARFSSALRRVGSSQAPATVGGGLMLALAAYYGALA